jgi:chromosome segregation ATPase
VNPLLFPPTLIKRALDDLAAIGDAARRLPDLEAEAVVRVDAVQAELTALRGDLRPIREMTAVREAIDGLRADIAGLREEMRPIRDMPALRAGIEPLDGDMRAVKESIDEIEPLVERVIAQIAGMDAKLDDMRGDLAPLGELAEKIPGIGR